ncbi:GEVED domain-containing protein [Tahibacter sp.]|uniref:GEVED domain-containing protein n=1 Tax=Tahibacter sp. TaxID=2056211 RepID=UPI0028C4D069|nr:GEVED domain-containing protein [Tahibacter sp.]
MHLRVDVVSQFRMPQSIRSCASPTRSLAAGNSDAINDPTGDAIWHAWSSVAGTPAATNNSVYPEPMFSDVVFDGADLVLGFRDRHGDHTGTGNVGTIRGITGGEILRACANGSGGWDLEQNGSCGGVIGAAGTATNQARGPNSVGNTRGGEFYGLEHYSDTTPPFFINDTPPDYNGRHDENAQGALNQVPGFPQVAITSMDPFRFNTGGLRWYNNATPNNVATTRGYEIFQTGAAGFSKANGLGDLNALCRAAPVEVGNYVWDDLNRNGVMDPGEPPIANVALTLYSVAGTALGAATTNTNGEYYFVFNQGATDASTTDNLIVAPNPYASSYTIGVMPANFTAGGPLANRRPTIATNAGPGTGLLRDSNGVAVTIPGNPATLGAAFTLAGAGSNDHTIDFGFGAVDFGDLPDTGAGTGAGNYATLSADNGASHGIVPGLFLGAGVDAEVDGQPNVAADGDDTAGTPDDEDGITLADLSLRTGTAAIVTATATNTTGSAAQLCGFVDFNGDGDFADAGESTSVAVANGATGAAFALNFGTVPPGASATTYARFRLSTDTGACSASGAAANGEVEDYPVAIASLDFGDLPDAAAGTTTGDYNTREADNGASHVIVPGLFMGAGVDAEGDGQPNAAANGDDTALTPDDEDGVNIADLTLRGGTSASIRVSVTNTTLSGSKLCGYVDFNGDGDFLDAGESALALPPIGSNNLTFTLTFPNVPLNAPASTYARFRLDNSPGQCTPTGAIASGEVEDYPVGIVQFDFGDLPDTGAGTGIGNYSTLFADSGASHSIVPNLHMGLGVDSESDGQPNVAANGDDSTGTPDDEDGVQIADLTMTAGLPAQVRVDTVNTVQPPVAAQLCGFVDFNGDGDFADAGETAPAVSIPAGSTAQFTLNFGTVPANAARSTYARFRLSTATGACNANGAAPDGEVEDYPVGIALVDWGDLPDTGAGSGPGNYATLLADGGARHVIVPTLYFGAGVDAEADSQPGAGANGDDANGTPDDEDGVNPADLSLQRGVTPVVNLTATNNTGTTAQVCGYIDTNADGDFADAGETSTTALPSGVTNFAVQLTFGAVPNTAATTSYARFRIRTDACSPNGGAPDGEVEDYPVNIGDGILSLGNLVWNDRDNDGTVDAGEPGLAGIAVALYADSDNNGVPDGAAVATTSTNAGGNYLFQNLNPDTYLVEIVPPAGYLGSTCTGLPYAASGTCEPAADPDNDIDNDDNGTAAGVTIRSGPVTLTVGGEPTNDGDGNNGNLSVDFGLLGNFDLALIKQLSTGQTGPFIVGQDVRFDITVFNQGAIAATTILVNDYIPAGLVLSPLETNWTAVSPTLATRTLAGPLAPGASLVTTILLRVTDTSVSPLVNRAEIGSADDDGDPSNTPPTDIDSTPDGNPGNDGGGAPNTPSDDATGGNGSDTPGGIDPNGDEDDADPAAIPVGSGSAVLGVAKAAQILGSTGGGGYGGGGAAPNADIAYIVLVRNYSTQAITSLQVVENLVATFGSGANWSVTGLTSPTLSVNPAYDGRGATNLLSGGDTLAAGATATIRLTVNLQFEPGRRYTNQVLGTGLVGTAPVSDLSQNGTNPAPNGNPGSDNEGTVIQLGSTSIPALSLPAILLLLAGLVLIVQQRRRLA